MRQQIGADIEIGSSHGSDGTTASSARQDGEQDGQPDTGGEDAEGEVAVAYGIP